MPAIQRFLLACVLLGLGCCPASQAARLHFAGSAAADACSGRAPSGELTAQRIAAANPMRSEAGLYEGPVWIKGALYFSDFSLGAGFPSRIQKLEADGSVHTWLDDSGSNGLAVDAQGNIVAATHKYKGLSRYDLATGKRTALAERFEGRVFNSPNDLTIHPDGSIYFTDPNFQRAAAPGGQDITGVYRVDPAGKVSLVERAIANPNGISLSRDGLVLYVNGGGERGFLRAYPIVKGVPQAGRTLVEGLVYPDGMALDCLGNLYVTEHTARRVRVFDPDGKPLALIHVDANVTNVAFGGSDGKTLFVTGAGALWQVHLDVSGTPY